MVCLEGSAWGHDLTWPAILFRRHYTSAQRHAKTLEGITGSRALGRVSRENWWSSEGTNLQDSRGDVVSSGTRGREVGSLLKSNTVQKKIDFSTN